MKKVKSKKAAAVPKKAVSGKKPATKKAASKAKAKSRAATVATKQPAVIDKKIYPIGKHAYPQQYTDQVMNKFIQDISILPEHLKSVMKKIKKKKLHNRYRDGGWTIEQLIHHLADSHINAYTRFKFALTENNPTIKPYDENLWAEMADVQACSLKDSLRIIRGIHKRWAAILENMSADDWKRTYFHPEHQRKFTLQEAISQYAWHGKHHIAQIELALKS